MLKFRTILNIVLISIFLCVSLFVIVPNFLNKVGVQLPNFLHVDEQNSVLEGRLYQTFPEISSENISDGTFQSKMETYVSDKVPMREKILIENANLQRKFIKFSNIFTNFDYYPTYYGSNVLHSSTKLDLAESPYKLDENRVNAINSTVGTFNSISSRYNNLNMYLTMAMRNEFFDDTSLSSLITAPFTYDYLDNHFLNELRGFHICDCIESYENYQNYKCTSDHHWNVKGAYSAYKKVAMAMGFGNSLFAGGDVISYKEPIAYGAQARVGRSLDCHDELTDFDVTMPYLTVKYDQNSEILPYEALAHKQAYASKQYLPNPYISRYGEYYHDDLAEFTIFNSNPDSNRTLLIVGDSFTDNCERFYAKHFKTVYVVDPRYIDKNADEFLALHPEITDVLILMSPNNLITDTTNTFLAGSNTDFKYSGNDAER